MILKIGIDLSFIYFSLEAWPSRKTEKVQLPIQPKPKSKENIFSLSETWDVHIPIPKLILNIFISIYSKNIICCSYLRIGNYSKNMNKERN